MKMTLQERIKDGYVLGLVFFQKTLLIYSAPSAWFIMNYSSYDPSITVDKDRSTEFRDGVLVVNDSTAESYLKSMLSDAVSIDELRTELPRNWEALQPIFLIDFDSKRYVSWFFDIDYEEYIPSDWEGIFANPLDYLPDEVRQIWQK